MRAKMGKLRWRNKSKLPFSPKKNWSPMNAPILSIIQNFSTDQISASRKTILQPLILYFQDKKDPLAPIRLNFICTHNSRRSHLSQIWAQTMAYHFGIKNVFCYSGGTEATALYPKVVDTLNKQGFVVLPLSNAPNPVYAVKYAQNESPLLCFSKTYDHSFNPKNDFAAIMTCNSADEACPMVSGAEARFSVMYEDPKVFDDTDLQDAKYLERSLEIGQEMWYVFSRIE
jgi:arsenate reductase (thioredoxin)